MSEMYTMIVRYGSKEKADKFKTEAFTLMSQHYQTIKVTEKQLIEAITKKQVEVTNLAIVDKKLTATNGLIDKYTLVDVATNLVVGVPKAVVIDRIETAGKLSGYTMFTQNGTLAEVSVADAVTLVNQKMISNGKVRHTEQGDIVSSINGNYPLRVVDIAKAPKGEVNTQLYFIGTAAGTRIKYFGAVITCTSAAEMSTIIKEMSTNNAELITKLVPVEGSSVKKSLAIKRIGANGIYGVFDASYLSKIAKGSTSVSTADGIIISAIEVKNEKTLEATLKLNNSWEIVENVEPGTDEELADAAKKLTKWTIENFSSIKIQ